MWCGPARPPTSGLAVMNSVRGAPPLGKSFFSNVARFRLCEHPRLLAMEEADLLLHHRATLEALPTYDGLNKGSLRCESPRSAPILEMAVHRRHSVLVIISVAIYWIAVAAVPVWNKHVMHPRRFPYAVATAAIQLGVVAAVLFLTSVVKHFAVDPRASPTTSETSSQSAPLLEESPSLPSLALYHEEREVVQKAMRLKRRAASAGTRLERRPGPGLAEDRAASVGALVKPEQVPAVAPAVAEHGASWVLGPHLGYKLRHVAPIGVLFGLKYVVTNLGLLLFPVSVHLLLQGTDILWTVLAARVINRETLEPAELLACALCLVGSCCVSVSAASLLGASPLPLVVNLLSPALLGLCIATLRRATVELMHPGNKLGGTMTYGELTCWKLMFSAVTAAVGAMLVDGSLSENGLPWWDALGRAPPSLVLGLLGGSLLVLIFQVRPAARRRGARGRRRGRWRAAERGSGAEPGGCRRGREGEDAAPASARSPRGVCVNALHGVVPPPSACTRRR